MPPLFIKQRGFFLVLRHRFIVSCVDKFDKLLDVEGVSYSYSLLSSVDEAEDWQSKE